MCVNISASMDEWSCHRPAVEDDMWAAGPAATQRPRPTSGRTCIFQTMTYKTDSNFLGIGGCQAELVSLPHQPISRAAAIVKAGQTGKGS